MYSINNIPLGDLDYIINEISSEEDIFTGKYNVFNCIDLFSREIKSPSYIEIPELKMRIFECNHEKYDYLEGDYVYKYRYYLVLDIESNETLFTFEDLSFILCVYNFICFYNKKHMLNRLDDFKCNIIKIN